MNPRPYYPLDIQSIGLIRTRSMSQVMHAEQQCLWPSYERQPKPLGWQPIHYYAPPANIYEENLRDRESLKDFVDYLEERYQAFREEITEDLRGHISDLEGLGEIMHLMVRDLEWRRYVWSNNIFHTNNEEVLRIFGEDEIISQRLYGRIKLLEILRYRIDKNNKNTLHLLGFTWEILLSIGNEQVDLRSDGYLLQKVASLLKFNEDKLGLSLTWGRSELCQMRRNLNLISI